MLSISRLWYLIGNWLTAQELPIQKPLIHYQKPFEEEETEDGLRFVVDAK